MDRTHTHEALRRIAAKLLALAELAERAGGRSRLLCCFVLWLLRPAEARACKLAADVGASPLIVSPASLSGETYGEAARLAESFRALAAIFFALADQVLGFASLPFTRRRAADPMNCRRPNAGRLLSALAVHCAHFPRAPP